MLCIVAFLWIWFVHVRSSSNGSPLNCITKKIKQINDLKFILNAIRKWYQYNQHTLIINSVLHRKYHVICLRKRCCFEMTFIYCIIWHSKAENARSQVECLKCLSIWISSSVYLPHCEFCALFHIKPNTRVRIPIRMLKIISVMGAWMFLLLLLSSKNSFETIPLSYWLFIETILSLLSNKCKYNHPR